MDFIVNDPSLFSAQREETQKAANLLITGKIIDHLPTVINPGKAILV